MREENNDILLGGGDALVHLAGPVHKKYSATFVLGFPFSMYISYQRFFNLPLPCTHMYLIRVTPFFVRDFIDLVLSSPILTLLVCHSFLILFYLRNSRITVFSQTLTTFWDLIQLTLAYLGRPFH